MSYQDAYAAMHLEMPPVVPRTEYSADFHWPLIKKVTGMEVHENSPAELQQKAGRALRKAWDYSFAWCTNINTEYFGSSQTNMGHAVYREEGTDRNDNIFCPFDDPEEVLNFDPAEHFAMPSHRELVERFNKSYHDSVNAPAGRSKYG